MRNSVIETLFYHLGRELLISPMQNALANLQTGNLQTAVKSDKTLVTQTDLANEELLKAMTARFFPEIPFQGEEGGTQDNRQHKYEFQADPMDGTRLFADESPGSSILLALYDTQSQTIPACHVGCIATGRVWSACAGQPVIRKNIHNPQETVVKVNQRQLSEQSSLRIDVSHGFNVFNDEQAARLFAGMQRLGRSVFYGSNCLNQALLANGGIDGAVSSAKGGPWDLAAGCCLVPAASGVTYAYRAEGEKVGHKRLIKLDRLDPFEADVLVMGNTKATADAIEQIVLDL